MKITCLTENTCPTDEFAVEHGLSLYIETKKHKILFDFGQSDLFAINAQKLGIDLSQVDIAFLSHAHYDHSGGIQKFLEINSIAPIYIRREAITSSSHNKMGKFIGIDKSVLSSPRLKVLTDECTTIDDELKVYSSSKIQEFYPINTWGLTQQTCTGFVADKFTHEQYVTVCEESNKTVLLSGCSHKGIDNIVESFKNDNIYALIGGFHYSKIENKYFNQLAISADRLKQHPIKYYTCHCTGVDQYEYMKNILCNRLDYLYCIKSIEL